MPSSVSPKLARFSWCLYDFGNSSFTTLIISAFGAPYFVSVFVGANRGATLWGLAISGSMLVVTLTSPWLGQLADRTKSKHKFLTVYTLVSVLATAGLGFLPGHSPWRALLFVALANFAYEGAYVFYNAFLPELTDERRLGRLSAMGWATGYVGGLLALVLSKPFMPHSYEAVSAADRARASYVFWIVAVWFLFWSLPAMALLRDARGARDTRTDKNGAESSKQQGRVHPSFLGSLRDVVITIRTVPALGLFLLMYFLYSDAITTVIEFTGIYTKDVLAFSPKDNITLFLLLNIVAAPGSILFGNLVDRFGAKRVVGIILMLWMLVVVGAVTATTRRAFWPVASLAALVLGATQAVSRAWMARLAPKERMAEYMGLLTLSGKASAILGPTLYGVLVDVFRTQQDASRGHRIAMATLGLFFVTAWIIRRRVPEANATFSAAS